MFDRLLDAIDAFDLTRLHGVLAFVGFFMTVYVMSLTGYEHEDRDDPAWLQWVRRVGYGTVALAFLWSLDYSHDHGWRPWPPELMLMIGIVIGMVVRATAIHLRIRREGRRVPLRGTTVIQRHRN